MAGIKATSISQAAGGMALVQWRRRSRASLMRGTALQAAALAVLASPAIAQLSPNARPGGGAVSAGQASIGGNASTTLITQKSQNAAINWQSYNVGSAQTVQYAQPNAASVTLNRVIGPDPSQIAGKILANGQVVIVNQSGVVFEKGSQVDTAGLVVSSAGISDKNFMAGRMVFDQAGHAGAIVSNAGNITIRQAGLAALVAPQVANSGTITAQLGRVILGGAVTHTLDLYGDGLVALNVTGQVTTASLGGRQVAALVTNTGTILAPGGTVVLSAAAVDGVVTNLVTAGGTIAAPTQGAQTGHILVQGIGGGITIAGNVSATGAALGTLGGQMEANATGSVTVATGATIDASGDSGGGLIALGTTAAHAAAGSVVPATLTANITSLAQGSTVRANATRHGRGGRVVVAGTKSVTQAGSIAVRGGSTGGDGGSIEIDSSALALNGVFDASAQTGRIGSLSMVVPHTELVEDSCASAPSNCIQFVDLANPAGSYAGTLVTTAGPITTGGPTTPGDIDLLFTKNGLNKLIGLAGPSVNGGISLNAAGDINIDSGVTVSGALGTSVTLLANGSVNLASTIGGGFGTTPSMLVASGTPSVAGAISITATTGSIVTGDINAGSNGSISLNAHLGITDGPDGTPTPGVIVAQSLTAISNRGEVDFENQENRIGTLFNSQAGTNFRLADGTLLTVRGSVSAPGMLYLSAPEIDIAGFEDQRLGTSVSGGTVILQADTFDLGSPVTATTLVALDWLPNSVNGATGVLQIGNVGEGSGNISGITEITAPKVALGTLDGVTRDTVTSGIVIATDFAPLTASGSSASVGLFADGPISEVNGAAIKAASLSGAATDPTTPATINSVTLTSNNTISTLGAFSADAGFSFTNVTDLVVTGAVSAGGDVVITTVVPPPPPGVVRNSPATPPNITVGNDTTGSVSGLDVTLTAAGGIRLLGSVTASDTGTLVTTTQAGDIDEDAHGSIFGGTLTGSASGSALFQVASGNKIGDIPGFTATHGDFSLEDDAVLNLVNLSAGGSISINGPTGPNPAAPTGPLLIYGSVTGTNITLSNSVGIAELSNASVISSSGGVTLTSALGAILQQPGAVLWGKEASATGTAVVIDAGGSNDFGTIIQGLDSVDGIMFGGSITAGTLSSTIYTGATALTASAGSIVESSTQTTTGQLLSGTLTSGSTVSGGVTTTLATTGDVDLDVAGNTLAVLGSFTANGNFTLQDDTALTVAGPVSVGGALTLHDPAGGSDNDGILVINGIINAGSVDFANGVGILETGNGTVTAATSLTETSGGAIVQLQAGTFSVTDANAAGGVGTLALTANGSTDFSNTSYFSLGTAVGGIVVGGNLVAGSTPVSVSGTNAAFSGTAILTASAGDITETSPTETAATGTIQAGTLTASAGMPGGSVTYSLSLDNGSAATPTNQIGTLLDLYADGSITIADDGSVFTSPNYNTVALQGANAAAGGLNIDIYGANLDISGRVTAATTASFTATTGPSTGSVISSGGINQLNGTISAQTVTIDAGYDVSQANGATIAANGGPRPSIDITASGYGLVGATPVTVYGVALGGTLTTQPISGGTYFGSVSLTATEGDVQERAPGASADTGVIQAGTLSATARLGTLTGASTALAGNVELTTASSAVTGTTSGTGNQIGVLGTSSAAEGFTLVDGGNLEVTQALAVQTSAVPATGDALSLHAPTLTISGSITLGHAGLASLVADQIAVPGTVGDTGGIVALDLLHAGTFTVVDAQGNGTIDAASLGNITAGTLALGSLNGTSANTTEAFTSAAGTWSAASAGSVTSLNIEAPLDVTSNAPTLGLFSNGSILNSVAGASNGITATSLYGAAGFAPDPAGGIETFANGTVTLAGSNAIGTLAGFATNDGQPANSGTAFALADMTGLLVTGPVTALNGGVSITAPQLTLAGNVTGTDVTLISGSFVDQTSGIITASGATATDTFLATSGTVILGAFDGAITLDGGIVAGQSGNGAYSGATLLWADGGDVAGAGSIKTGTLAAASSNNISLSAATNSIAAIGALTSSALPETLYGLSASGAAGITLATTGDLGIADNQAPGTATVSGIGTSRTWSDSGTGTVSISVNNGGLFLGDPEGQGATVEAQGNVALQATGLVMQFGGLVISSSGNVGVTSSGSYVSQSGGTFSALADVDVTAWTDIGQSAASILAANGDAVVTAGTSGTLGALTQADGSLISAGHDVVANAYDETDGIAIEQSGLSTIEALTDVVRLKTIVGGLMQTTSTIFGHQGVGLDIFGSIVQSGGSKIQSSEAIAIASRDGGIRVGGLVESGGSLSGTVFTPAGSSDVLLSAGNGDINEQNAGAASGQILAGTLAAAATGNINLAGGTNMISAVGSLSNSLVVPGLTLAGLAAHGTGGIALIDDTSLAILPDVAGVPTVQSFANGATISIAEIAAGTFVNHVLTYGSLTLGGPGGTSVVADGNITLTSTGSISQTLGVVKSTTGSVAVLSNEGDVTQSGGSLLALAGNVSVQAAGTISQSAGTIDALDDVTVTAGGDVMQALGSQIHAQQDDALITAGSTPSPLNLFGGDIVQTDSRIQAGGNVMLFAQATQAGYGNIAQSNGSSTVANGSLTATAAGDVSQSASTILAAQDIDITAAGSLSQMAGSEIRSTAGNVALAAGSTTFTPNLDLPGGDVVQDGSTVVAREAITVAANATQPGFGNIVQTGASAFAAGTNATLSAAGSIAFAGLIAGAGSSGTVLLSAGGDITELNAAGSFTGFVTGGTLAALPAAAWR